MKLGLSNFQPVAASEIIEQEVLDLGDVEQLTAPMIESDRDLASLIREVGFTSIRDVDQLVGELEVGERLPEIRRGAHPSCDSALHSPYSGRFGFGKGHL